MQPERMATFYLEIVVIQILIAPKDERSAQILSHLLAVKTGQTQRWKN